MKLKFFFAAALISAPFSAFAGDWEEVQGTLMRNGTRGCGDFSIYRITMRGPSGRVGEAVVKCDGSMGVVYYLVQPVVGNVFGPYRSPSEAPTG